MFTYIQYSKCLLFTACAIYIHMYVRTYVYIVYLYIRIGLLRTASKVTVPIDKVFGGVKLSTVICRECHTVSSRMCNYACMYDILS